MANAIERLAVMLGEQKFSGVAADLDGIGEQISTRGSNRSPVDPDVLKAAVKTAWTKGARDGSISAGKVSAALNKLAPDRYQSRTKGGHVLAMRIGRELIHRNLYEGIVKSGCVATTVFKPKAGIGMLDVFEAVGLISKAKRAVIEAQLVLDAVTGELEAESDATKKAKLVNEQKAAKELLEQAEAGLKAEAEAAKGEKK